MFVFLRRPLWVLPRLYVGVGRRHPVVDGAVLPLSLHVLDPALVLLVADGVQAEVLEGRGKKTILFQSSKLRRCGIS